MMAVNKIAGHLIFLSCAILPFSYQLSTFLLMGFSFLILLGNFKIPRLNEKHVFLEIIELPWFIFAIPMIGLLSTAYIEDSVNQIIKYLPYFILSTVYFFTEDKMKKLLRVRIIYGFIVGVSLVLVYLFSIILYEVSISADSFSELFSYKYSYNNFIIPLDSHPTYLGFLVIISNFFVYHSKKLNLPTRISLLILNGLGLFFIMSKIIIVIYFTQIIGMFFTIKSKRSKRNIILFFLFIAVATGYLFKFHSKDIYFLQRFSLELMWDLNPNNTNHSINGRVEDDSRFARWSVIWAKMNESIIFGHGSGSEKTILNEVYEENSLLVSLERKYNTHNQFLFFGIEYGIIGIILFFSFLFTNLYMAYKRNDFFNIYFIIWLFLICCFENYLNRTMGVLLVSIILTFMRPQWKK